MLINNNAHALTNQRCNEKDLRQETMFLGISLLDRFLSKGFFKNERTLQIVGIACLALATRIEENQPYNGYLLYLYFLILFLNFLTLFYFYFLILILYLLSNPVDFIFKSAILILIWFLISYFCSTLHPHLINHYFFYLFLLLELIFCWHFWNL